MENGTPLDSVLVPPADAVPVVIPAPVEPVGGVSLDYAPVPVIRGRGRPPEKDNLRMELILAFISGQLPASRDPRIKFVKAAGFTVREKAFLLRHEYFKDFFDSKLFDMAMGLEDYSKDEIKLLSIIAGRLGLTRSPISVNARNVKMDNKDGGQVSIRVEQ